LATSKSTSTLLELL